MSDKKKKVNRIEELGEFGLIDKLTRQIKLKRPESIKGVGDDAAVLDFKGKQVVATSDMLMEGIHFNLMYTPLKHLGYKAVVVNLSDVYAMNALPTQVVVNIALSSKFTVDAVEELYNGIRLACERYGVDLVGGDTSSSVTGLAISITALGTASADELVYRNGAKKNELICVSGNLGGAYLGLQLLEREKEVFKVNPHMQPEFSGFDYILERQLKPEARKDIIELFKELGIKPSSMIDVSDGLSSEVMHLCKQSGTGCVLHEEHIPFHPETILAAREFDLETSVCALNGGEDYELLFTLPLDMHDKVKERNEFSIIGHMTAPDEGCKLFGKTGGAVELKAQGWDGMKSGEGE